VWAVAVEGNGASVLTSVLIWREVRKHRIEARGKTLTFLRNYARFFAF
jgi:hypothetical protein